MKQYQIQMCVNGEWRQARYQTGHGWRTAYPPTDIEDAREGLCALREDWKRNKNVFAIAPTDFRIVSREVGDWTPE